MIIGTTSFRSSRGLSVIASRPAFGVGSRAKHHRLAQTLRLRVTEVCRPGLAFDLDTPCDVAALGPGQAFNSLSVPVTTNSLRPCMVK